MTTTVAKRSEQHDVQKQEWLAIRRPVGIGRLRVHRDASQTGREMAPGARPAQVCE